jgi:hypothetical protein
MRRCIAIASTIGGLLAVGAPTTTFAAPARHGGQIEGLAGISVCIDGRAGCTREAVPIRGDMGPSFGGGLALGARPLPWLVIAGLYRAGLFDPDYSDGEGEIHDRIVQHTVGLVVRPILPVWRFDFGLNLGVGYSRQSADFRETGRREFTQGASFITGVTIDAFITDHLFAGFGVDVLANLHGTVCRRTHVVTDCLRAFPSVTFGPNHQVLLGVRFGSTFG